MNKQVRDLKIGDILTPTMSKVVVAPSAGITTPSGKMDLIVETSKGKHVFKTWGKFTEVSIKD